MRVWRRRFAAWQLSAELLSPRNVEDQPFDWQREHRFAGWFVSLGALGLVLVRLALPLGEAGIPTLVAGERRLSGFYLRKGRIRRFLESFEGAGTSHG